MKTEYKIIISSQGVVLGVLLLALYLIFTNYTPTYEVEVYKDHTVWHTTDKPTQSEPQIGEIWTITDDVRVVSISQKEYGTYIRYESDRCYGQCNADSFNSIATKK